MTVYNSQLINLIAHDKLHIGFLKLCVLKVIIFDAVLLKHPTLAFSQNSLQIKIKKKLQEKKKKSHYFLPSYFSPWKTVLHLSLKKKKQNLKDGLCVLLY